MLQVLRNAPAERARTRPGRCSLREQPVVRGKGRLMNIRKHTLAAQLVAGTLGASLVAISIGCRSAETRNSSPLAARSSTNKTDSNAEPSGMRPYVPPAVDEPSRDRTPLPAPPAPVSPIDNGVSWSFGDRFRGGLKQTSSELSDAPRLMSPVRARSLREAVAFDRDDAADL